MGGWNFVGISLFIACFLMGGWIREILNSRESTTRENNKAKGKGDTTGPTCFHPSWKVVVKSCSSYFEGIQTNKMLHKASCVCHSFQGVVCKL